MSSQALPFLTPEQYLEIERNAERKSEYWNGEMFAMAGATAPHNLVASNTSGLAHAQLRSKPCRVYHSDMRVRVLATGLNTYPDVVIVCGEQLFLDGLRDTLLNPKAIVEVLSPSTEAYDRGRKFGHYRQIESLEQYLLLSQDRMQAELFSRQPSGQWLLAFATHPEEFVDLSSVGCKLSLAECYEKVDFPLNSGESVAASDIAGSAMDPPVINTPPRTVLT
jgi:Uma2 family endonuclease